ncbi:MAG: serine/threonine-protein kinase, partial [Myxococcaceae bacterium]
MSAPPEVNPSYLPPGTRIGFYEVVTLIASGGFGSLYKVLRDGEVLALKLASYALEGMSAQERTRHEERADREVVALKSLRHPNIVRVHAFERWPTRDGYPYIVMDFVEGDRLYEWKRKRAPTFRQVCAVFRKLAGALHEMHRLEVFHRDLKSENVLVRADGEPVLIDFGISRPRSAFTVTKSQSMLGTVTHFSPEYCRYFLEGGWKSGERFVYRAASDLHCVGYMLYQMVAGMPPFETHPEDEIDLINEIAERPPKDPRSHNSQIPEALARVALRLLEKAPENRFASGEALAHALDTACTSGDKAWDVTLGPKQRERVVSTATAKPSTPKDAPVVLYVEDDDDSFLITHARLAPKYQVLRARNDIEACQVLRKQGSSLLVILMDIQLQDSRLDGVALTRLVRGTLKDEPLPAYAMGCPVLSTPIFFVTAHTERFPEPGLLAAGGDRV